jgi:hypothetical protein
MKVKGKRILKNGTIAGYVYNSKTKKWNWRFIGRQTGGDRTKDRKANFNTINAYQKERNALLNYLDDKVRRTAFFRPKRKKKFRNISNRIRKSVKNNEINGVNVLKKAYENIGLILDNGTRNNNQLFKNLTNKVVKYRTQREQNKIKNNKNLKIILNKVQRGQNF